MTDGPFTKTKELIAGSLSDAGRRVTSYLGGAVMTQVRRGTDLGRFLLGR